MARRKRFYHYFIKYTGKHKHISLSGVGRITQGKEVEVQKKVADFIRDTKDWKVRVEYELK